jgi:hypothetical protein
MEKHDQSILVPANVEHMQISDLVDAGKALTEFGEVRECLRFHQLPPCLHRTCGFRMLGSEFNQSAIGDDSHRKIIGPTSNYCNMQ